MKITDSAVLKELKRVRSFELEESIASYPDNERDGRSDMQVLADECSWILSNYAEDGHVLHDDLEEAKEIIRKTKNGKVMVLWKDSLKPVWSKSRIETARASINEFKRLQNLLKRLNANGYHGQWFCF